MARCPSCAEKISATETECPHCGEDLESGGGRKPSPTKKKKKSSGSNGSMFAIIAVVAFGGLVMCGGVLVALLLPAVQQAREAARRTQCKNNLKQIGLALHNYHDTFAMFPAAHLNDEQDQPRLSWRVSILPYIDASPAYQMYAMGEPWDSATNSQVLRSMPRTYTCPSHSEPGGTTTAYATVTGEHTVLGSGTCHRIREITDGTSNTVMVIEACQMNIPWTKPHDIDADMFTRIGDPNGASSRHRGGVNALLADGSVRFISDNIDPQIMKNIISRDDGNAICGEF